MHIHNTNPYVGGRSTVSNPYYDPILAQPALWEQVVEAHFPLSSHCVLHLQITQADPEEGDKSRAHQHNTVTSTFPLTVSLSSSSVNCCGFSLPPSASPRWFGCFLCQGNLQGIKACTTIKLLIFSAVAPTQTEWKANVRKRVIFYWLAPD